MHNIIMTAAWQIAGVIFFLSLCVSFGIYMSKRLEVEEKTPETQHNSMVYWISEKAS